MIELKSLSKTYSSKNGSSYEALKDIDLRVDDGDIYGIIGVSGAGKSTLVRCMNLLERPTAGQVLIDGEDITHYQGRHLFELRSRIGMIFQDFNLFTQRTVLKNVLFPLEIRHDGHSSALSRARELLELVGLSDMEDRYPSQLSGGQQQRVSIARALANRPSYLLCDELTSALDSLTTASILALLAEINRTLGVTIVIITHAMSVVQAVCNKVAVIDGSRIVEAGRVTEVFSSPQARITLQLLGLEPVTAAAPAAAGATGTINAHDPSDTKREVASDA
ncbi:MAG: ATP-binding cassette domain-containing protein [Coriobacteriales bacterium]|nr:ATP-binding cassette domain-containing protein [Coriobacteriales bacterium]